MLSFLLMLACTESTGSTVPRCDLTAPVITPAESPGGGTVVAVSRPMTEVWDTVVTVGAVNATISAVDRSECDSCDSCRETAECNVCDSCASCATECATCVESVSFVVPELAPGSHQVVVTNLHAASAAVSLTVIEADTGSDTGADTGGDTSDSADTGGDSADGA